MPPNSQNGGGGAAASFPLATSGPKTNVPCSLLRGTGFACEGSSCCSRLLPLEGRILVDDFGRGLSPDTTTRLGLAVLPVEAVRRRRISSFSGCLPNSLMGVPMAEDTGGEEISAIAMFVPKAPVRNDGWYAAVVPFRFVVKLSPPPATLRPCCAMTQGATDRDASRTPSCGG